MTADTIAENVSTVEVVYSPILVDSELQADIVAQQFKEAGVNILVCAPDTWAFPQLSVISLLAHFPKRIPINFTCGNSGPKPGVVFADTLPMIVIPRKLQTEIEGQVLVLEFLRSVSDVNWSYATPAKNFTNGKRTGVFRIGGDKLLESSSGRSRISRADFAVAVIDEVENPQYIQQRFSVVY